MENRKSSSSFWTKVVYFFPLQLFFVHLKKNQQLLLFWLFLFLIIFQAIGTKYGIPYLFIAPEYLGELSIASYFIVGFSIGGFVVAFNISSYIMNAFRFPFLATLSKPFYKYSVNNSVLPTFFVLSYIFNATSFLNNYENFNLQEITLRMFGFLIGYFLFLGLSTIYFLATNKDFENLFGKDLAKVITSDGKSDEPGQILLKKKSKTWYGSNRKTWRIDSYIGGRFQLKATRSYKHYDKKMLSQVFRQNHVNASFFQIAIIVSIIILGLFRENDFFIIPAGATITLLFTTLIMLTSAIRSWTQGWSLVVIAGFLVVLNLFTTYDSFYYESKAFGMSYSNLADYKKTFEKPTKNEIEEDLNLTINKLNNWKSKQEKKKPKAIFIATSGGGSRASFWSFLAIQHLDSITNGKLMKQTIMGTGSSGGMIGMAYYRELYLQNQHQAKNQNLAKDNLNSVVFTLAVNDLLVRTQRIKINNELHWKDRGYIFDKVLNENTNDVFKKELGDYSQLEQTAEIPTLIYTPSIINDSRRLLIANNSHRFMVNHFADYVDYQSLFKNNDANKLHYSTLLRMNASFPYIMPTVCMPTSPEIEVFDAGLRDNYGMKTTVNYIFEIRDWLEENTSGIIVLQIRDGMSSAKLKTKKKSNSLLSEIASPFGSIYGNWFNVQDYNNQETVNYMKGWFKGNVDVLSYELYKSEQENISLSWHLTTREKHQVVNSLTLTNNLITEQRLNNLIQEP